MKPLGTNVEDLRSDFESVTGVPFQHFYCPILHVDEEVPLARGHVVPESLGGKVRVLQRADVDNGFGSFFEAEAVDAIRLGLDGAPLDVVFRADAAEMKTLERRFDFQLLLEGTDKPLDASFRKLADETGFYVRTEDLKAELGEEYAGRTVLGAIMTSLDARSSILATSLRTSHLAWFQMRGYRYALSNEGVFVAWVLRSFYEKFIAPQHGSGRTKGSLMSSEVKRQVDEYCTQFANLIRPLPRETLETLPEGIRQGTQDTGWFIALWDGDEIYGRLSIVRLGNQHVGVITPVITDARGWALLDVAANLELAFSTGWIDSDASTFRINPPCGRLIWPSVPAESMSSSTLSIREAAQLVITSGRMLP